MSSGATPQIHPDALDIDNLSVTSASKSPTDDRYGRIWEPVNLAAGVPVFFHHLGLTNYLALFSQRWYAASPTAGSHPGYYPSGYTVDNLPSWVALDAVTGHVTPAGPSSAPYTIPTKGTYDTRVLNAAYSRSEYLYTLNTVGIGADSFALVQFFRRNFVNQMVLVNEELIPTVSVDSQVVLFDRGLYLSTPYLYFLGAGLTDKNVYLARKKWAAIGSNTVAWEYQHAIGWSTDTTEVTKVMTTDNVPLNSIGPIGAGTFQDRTYISCVAAAGSNRNAQVYVNRKSMQWRPVGSASLGTSTTYTGGTLYFQSQVGANPANSALTNNANSSAFPAVVSTYDTLSSENAIKVDWSLWPITRLA